MIYYKYVFKPKVVFSFYDDLIRNGFYTSFIPWERVFQNTKEVSINHWFSTLRAFD